MGPRSTLQGELALGPRRETHQFQVGGVIASVVCMDGDAAQVVPSGGRLTGSGLVSLRSRAPRARVPLVTSRRRVCLFVRPFSCAWDRGASTRMRACMVSDL
jgi:hypothetical protein